LSDSSAAVSGFSATLMGLFFRRSGTPCLTLVLYTLA
jgi:hypothetical protein